MLPFSISFSLAAIAMEHTSSADAASLDISAADMPLKHEQSELQVESGKNNQMLSPPSLDISAADMPLKHEQSQLQVESGKINEMLSPRCEKKIESTFLFCDRSTKALMFLPMTVLTHSNFEKQTAEQQTKSVRFAFPDPTKMVSRGAIRALLIVFVVLFAHKEKGSGISLISANSSIWVADEVKSKRKPYRLLTAELSQLLHNRMYLITERLPTSCFGVCT
ncbi:hypothetical protein AXG93_2480s1030 [Marchantia polymorpha subsp. ruderalis]|uniref:Uncharacterized protein n=1 Tax=Marchantia polymorpha subsp. ruderalis TaxID=1480154 RepID=A0A176WHE6_MARPO|nr:hypothetical protein AXG93_2480s1030 [Marchantia polymorpha subsp. ruderalis]